MNVTARGWFNVFIVVVLVFLPLAHAFALVLIHFHLSILLQINIAPSLCYERSEECQESKTTLKYSLK